MDKDNKNEVSFPLVALLYADVPCLNNRIYPMNQVMKLSQKQNIPLFIGFQREDIPDISKSVGYVNDLAVKDGALVGNAVLFKDKLPEGCDISELLQNTVIRTSINARVNRNTASGIDEVFDVDWGAHGHCAIIPNEDDAFNKDLLEKVGVSISAKGKVDNGNSNPV